MICDNYFVEPESRAAYVVFLNACSTRILPGTDFAALHTKTFDIHAEKLRLTSDIPPYRVGPNYFELPALDYVAPEICS